MHRMQCELGHSSFVPHEDWIIPSAAYVTRNSSPRSWNWTKRMEQSNERTNEDAGGDMAHKAVFLTTARQKQSCFILTFEP